MPSDGALMTAPFVHDTAVVDDGAQVGHGTRVWHFTHVSAGSVIGARCVLGQNVFIGPGVKIGDGVKIQNNVSVYAGVALADDVFLGPSCVFTNVLTPRAHVERKEEFAPTPVGKGVTVGKTRQHNLTLLARLSLFHSLGVPLRGNSVWRRRLRPLWRSIPSDDRELPMGEKS